MNNQFKELGKFSKILQLEKYIRCYKTSDLPPKTGPEVLIVGKSNVGKSSLINTLLNHNIAKISRQPGCTKWIGYLKLRKISLIDLPGYGFAKVSKGRKEFWNLMVHEYLDSGRVDMVFMLVDSRKGIQAEDTFTADLFRCPKLFLYTKSDLNNLLKTGHSSQIHETSDHSEPSNCVLPENTIAVSSKNGRGIEEIRTILANLNEENFDKKDEKL